MIQLQVHQSGILVGTKEGETVILLPPGPIRTTVVGQSGVSYDQTLVDDPDLGHPTALVTPIKSTGTIFNHL